MNPRRPIIGCTTYRKKIDQARPIDVYGLMPSYTEAITKAGGIPLLIPLGLSEDDLRSILRKVDGLMLPGGGDVSPNYYQGRADVPMWGIDPERDRTELFLCRAAVDENLPLLAICRGMQVLNVALGGTLIEDIKAMRPDSLDHDMPDHLPRSFLSHSIEIMPGSILGDRVGGFECMVNSIHHQGVGQLAPELKISAVAPDGLIEAAEIPDQPFVLGVQWHPENLVDNDPAMLSLFKGLIQAAGEKQRPSLTLEASL